MELEPLVDHDASSLGELFFSIGMSPELNIPAAASFIRHINSDKAIGRKLIVNGVFVGGGQLTVQKYPHAVELGIWVRRECQGNGYGSIVARSLTELALSQLSYHRIFAKTFSNNIKSQRCLERAGMMREGVLRAVGLKGGVYYDEIYYGRLKTDPSP